jgi:LmbE family N-acetylglucosaminyl deacetylase
MSQLQEKPRLGIVPEHKPDKPMRILVVNADDNVSIPLRKIFQSISSLSLDIAPDTETATRMLAAEPYDLVALDPAQSPGGFELLKHIKTNFRWTATLLATHNQDPQFLRQAVKCRIDGLLFRKPEVITEFVEQCVLLAEGVSARRKRQQKRVLAIGAHPDDVEIGCGGALAKHRADYDVLHILTLSRGAVGGDVNVRAVEAHDAAALLGARLEMANLRDTFITDGAETISIIEAEIRELRPTHVYTHSLEDTHQDHRAVHAASLVAARGVPNVYCYQSPSSTTEFKPHRFVDITHFIDRKIELIGAYKSQVDRMESIQPDVILSTARYWGRFAGYVLAEPLRIVRQRDSAMALDLAEEQEQPQSASVAGGT